VTHLEAVNNIYHEGMKFKTGNLHGVCFNRNERDELKIVFKLKARIKRNLTIKERIKQDKSTR
jgi:hypothetical protein